jgi:hypothetical protein
MFTRSKKLSVIARAMRTRRPTRKAGSLPSQISALTWGSDSPQALATSATE